MGNGLWLSLLFCGIHLCKFAASWDLPKPTTTAPPLTKIPFPTFATRRRPSYGAFDVKATTGSFYGAEDTTKPTDPPLAKIPFPSFTTKRRVPFPSWVPTTKEDTTTTFSPPEIPWPTTQTKYNTSWPNPFPENNVANYHFNSSVTEARKHNPDWSIIYEKMQDYDKHLLEFLQNSISPTVNWENLLASPEGKKIGWSIIFEQAASKFDWAQHFKKLNPPVDFSLIFATGAKPPHTNWSSEIPSLGINWRNQIGDLNYTLFKWMVDETQKADPNWNTIFILLKPYNPSLLNILNTTISGAVDWSKLLKHPEGIKIGWNIIFEQAADKHDWIREFKNSTHSFDIHDYFGKKPHPSWHKDIPLLPRPKYDWETKVKEPGWPKLNWPKIVTELQEQHPNWTFIYEEIGNLQNPASDPVPLLKDVFGSIQVDWESVLSQNGGSRMGWTILFQHLAGKPIYKPDHPIKSGNHLLEIIETNFSKEWSNKYILQNGSAPSYTSWVRPFHDAPLANALFRSQVEEAKKTEPLWEQAFDGLQTYNSNLPELLQNYISPNVNWTELLESPEGFKIGWTIVLEQAAGKHNWIKYFENLTRPVDFKKIFIPGNKPHSNWPWVLPSFPTPGPPPPLESKPPLPSLLNWTIMNSELQGNNPNWTWILNMIRDLPYPESDPIPILNYLFQRPKVDWESLLRLHGGSNIGWTIILEQMSGKYNWTTKFQESNGGIKLDVLLRERFYQDWYNKNILEFGRAPFRVNWTSPFQDNVPANKEWFQLIEQVQSPRANWTEILNSAIKIPNVNLEETMNQFIAPGYNLSSQMDDPYFREACWGIILLQGARKTNFIERLRKRQENTFDADELFQEGVGGNFNVQDARASKLIYYWKDIIPSENDRDYLQQMLGQAQQKTPNWTQILNNTGQINADLLILLLEKNISPDVNWSQLLAQPGGQRAAWYILLQQTSRRMDFKEVIKIRGTDIVKWLHKVVDQNVVNVGSVYEGVYWPKVLEESGDRGVDWSNLIELVRKPNPDWPAIIQSAKTANLNFTVLTEKSRWRGRNLEKLAAQPGGRDLVLAVVLNQASGYDRAINVTNPLDSTGMPVLTITIGGCSPIPLPVQESPMTVESRSLGAEDYPSNPAVPDIDENYDAAVPEQQPNQFLTNIQEPIVLHEDFAGYLSGYPIN